MSRRSRPALEPRSSSATLGARPPRKDRDAERFAHAGPGAEHVTAGASPLMATRPPQQTKSTGALRLKVDAHRRTSVNRRCDRIPRRSPVRLRPRVRACGAQ